MIDLSLVEDEHEHHHHHHDEDGECSCGHHHDEDEHEHHHHHQDGEECSCGHHEYHHADEVFTSWGQETIRKYTRRDYRNFWRHSLQTRPMVSFSAQREWLRVPDGTWIYF